MTALHDAHEKLRRERDGLDVVLGASCGTCVHWKLVNVEKPTWYGECSESGWQEVFMPDHWCAAWEQREETTA